MSHGIMYLELYAEQLKEICDENGKELDLKTSAQVFYQLGMEILNRKPTDKISLLKCVGLLNAAVVRNPENKHRIQEDLSRVCKYILQLACDNPVADLIEEANSLEGTIEKMRSKAQHSLDYMKCRKTFEKDFQTGQNHKIDFIKKIQYQITTDYTKIMQELSQYCMLVMGPPPCKFVIAGMGSLARKEITPYSDFEHIILLEVQSNYKQNLEYFQWFSVIFHVIVLNLKETIVPSLNIKALEGWFFDTQRSGISFDGMMPHACKFPLGRTEKTLKKPWTTELIQPVDKMLEFLRSEKSLKNGYHLSEILSESCFVFGDKNVYEEFKLGVRLSNLAKTDDEWFEEIRKQVKEDLEKFSARFTLAKLKLTKHFNVKQLFYRSSTLFLAAIGKMKLTDVKSPSCFDIIEKLAKKGEISYRTKHKLFYVVAVACEIRLRVYMKKQSQYDYIQTEDDVKMFGEVLKDVGKVSAINYFQIAYCLQCELINIKSLQLKKTYLYSNPKLLNIAICYALGFDDLLKSLLSQAHVFHGFNATSESLFLAGNRPFFDNILGQLEAETNFFQESSDKPLSPFHIQNICRSFQKISEILFNAQQYSDANEFFQKALCILNKSYNLQNKFTDEQKARLKLEGSIVLTRLYIGICQFELDDVEKAAQSMCEFSKKYYYLEAVNEPNKLETLYYFAGDLFFKLNRYDDALKFLRLSFKIAKSQSHTSEKPHYMQTYSGIGHCLMHLNKYADALEFLNTAANIIQTYHIVEDSCTFKYAFTVRSTFAVRGKCFMNLGKSEEALQDLYNAEKIALRFSTHRHNSHKIADIRKDILEVKNHLQMLEHIQKLR